MPVIGKAFVGSRRVLNGARSWTFGACERVVFMTWPLHHGSAPRSASKPVSGSRGIGHSGGVTDKGSPWESYDPA